MRLLGTLAVGTAVVMLVACGSAGTGTAGASSTAAASGPTSTSVAAVNPPPANLTAVSLVGKADLAKELGEPISAIQDDGGVTASADDGSGDASDFESQVELATSDTHLAIVLTAYPSASAAQTGYDGDVADFAEPVSLPGLGSEAAADVRPNPCATVPADVQVECFFTRKVGLAGLGEVAVRDGGQVLTVEPSAAPAVAAEVRPSPGTPASVQQAIALINTIEVVQPQAVAKALAPLMSGQTSTGTYLELPEGALNPCAASSSTIASELKTDVTAVNVMSDTPPEQECLYTIGGESYTAYTETGAQAADSVPLTSLQAMYAKDAQDASTSTTLGPTDGISIQTFMDGGELFDTDSLVILPVTASARLVAGAGIVELGDTGTSPRDVLLRLEAAEGASAGQTTTKELCYDVLTQMMISEMQQDDGSALANSAIRTKYVHYIQSVCAQLASQ
jgi:hypothetical protein